MKIEEYISLAPLTVFKIGGKARFFCEVTNQDEIREACVFAKSRKVPYVIIGAGSNVLISDNGYEGLIIKMNMRSLSVDGTIVTADAGVSMAQVVAISIGVGLTGFEWGVGVPGTIGGSVRGNAGCYGSEMKDVVEKILVFDSDSGTARYITNEQVGFGYRDSIFKVHPEIIILSTSLRLKKGDQSESRARITAYSRARISDAPQASGKIGRQEIGQLTAGSTFKNVILSEDQKNNLLTKFPQIQNIFDASKDSIIVPAGFLIDIAGLKGMQIGGAMISKHHANFIINTGEASAQNVIDIIRFVKEKIYETFGITLEEEIQCIGFE